jgi:hypothetical protein
MRAMLAIVLSVFFVSNALSAQNDLESRRVYIALTSDNNVCVSSEKMSQEEIKDDCKTPSTYIYLELDLNNDGINDLVLRNQWGRHSWGLDIFTILWGMKDGSFIEINKFLTTDLKPTRNIKNDFLVLRSHAICGDHDGMEFGESEADLVFDPKSSTYKMLGVDEDNPADGTICSINKEAVKAREEYSKKYHQQEME